MINIKRFNLAKTAILLGVTLILLGIISYFGTGRQSITALIPTFFGILILITGILGRNEKYKKHAMHAAVMLALLGFLGTLSGMFKLFTLLNGRGVARPEAVIVQSIMAVLCVIFVIMGVQSFIKARRK
jgi:uncharacterized membrane protein